jgi:hypothetical protein
MATVTELKRELEQLSAPDLIRICLRLARLKHENKELLAYLLRDAEDPLYYAETLKPAISDILNSPAPSRYLLAKQLRRSNRIITRYARFTGSKQGELELLLHQVEQFHQVLKNELSSAVASRMIFRALRKSDTLMLKLHDELQGDYKAQLHQLFELSFSRLGRDYFDGKPLQSINVSIRVDK